LFGCAEAPGGNPNRVGFFKPGSRPGDFERDNGICTRQAESARKQIIGARDASKAYNRVLISCLRERGWQRSSDVASG
jgi:hypothetical protein